MKEEKQVGLIILVMCLVLIFGGTILKHELLMIFGGAMFLFTLFWIMVQDSW